MKKLIMLCAFLATSFPTQMNASKYPALGVAGLGCFVAAIYYGCSFLPEPGVSEKIIKRREMDDLSTKKLQDVLAINHDATGLGALHQTDDKQKQRVLQSIKSLQQITKAYPGIHRNVQDFSDHFNDSSPCTFNHVLDQNNPNHLVCPRLNENRESIRLAAGLLENEHLEWRSKDRDGDIDQWFNGRIKLAKKANKKTSMKYWSFLSMGTFFLCFYAHLNSIKN